MSVERWQATIDEVAKQYVQMEVVHAAEHDLEGIGPMKVIEQQTGHAVCGWCGWCEGDCE